VWLSGWARLAPKLSAFSPTAQHAFEEHKYSCECEQLSSITTSRKLPHNITNIKVSQE
jgi:hypothetical protein